MPKCLRLGALTVAATLVASCDRPQANPAGLRSADVASSMSSVTAALTLPASVRLNTQLSSCDNSPGPYITMSGVYALGGLGSRLIFRNNAKGTHTYAAESHSDVTVVPNGNVITIPKQPVRGGVGGNPFIWIQFTDEKDTPMSGEIYLGRCVQGFNATPGLDFSVASAATANFEAAGCYNSPGPTITMSGDLRVSPGLGVRFIFRNNDNPVGGPHEFDDATLVRVTLVPPGLDVQFPKQPVLGGVGGNPWISFQFLSGAGATLTSEYLLGRCVQMTKAG